jgi:RimJ/RimL family protein N-acetyltransferase
MIVVLETKRTFLRAFREDDLSSKKQGIGFAIEVSRSLINYAFKVIKVKRVVAKANKDNVASI